MTYIWLFQLYLKESLQDLIFIKTSYFTIKTRLEFEVNNTQDYFSFEGKLLTAIYPNMKF